VGRRDGAGRDLDIPARMHGQRRMDRGWILGRLPSFGGLGNQIDPSTFVEPIFGNTLLG
jgi:hypothetical protein